MSTQKKIKYGTMAAIAALIIVLAIFGNGSQLINNYSPNNGASSSKDEIVITYNDDVLNEVTGGYSGAPTLVASDDKVFYIPPDYCDGSYLRNFRVIGMNLSGADCNIDSEGNISDYNGAVVLYGFQTTYRDDYGTDYDFDYEPYDYNVEYGIVDSFMEDIINGTADSSKYFDNDTSLLWTPSGTDETEEESDTEESDLEIKIKSNVEFEENEDVVDDSDFKVATLVMEHEIGNDECKILYCDADAATVGELDEGKYNLITNLSDDALTVCFNEQMYVYSFDESGSTYAANDIYMYDLNDLFDSSTYKNSMAEAGFYSVKYNAAGEIKFDKQTKGWVNSWLNCVTTKTAKSDVEDPAYLSNLTSAAESKESIHKNFLNMDAYLASAIEDAYKGYKKTTSGSLSYEHSTSVVSFGDYSYNRDTQNNTTWTLTSNFEVHIQETSWNIIFPHTYKYNPTGTVTINIVPEYTLHTEYTYTIDDLILTKYDSSDENCRDYSMILQLMITPANEENISDDLEELEDIENFDAYLADADSDTTPEGVDEDELDDEDEDTDESDETVKEAVSAQYLTFNINLSQEEGETEVESIKVLTITNANEVKSEIDSLKAKYKTEYDENISAFASEIKSGPYVIPKSFTIESIEDFKNRFYNIVTTRKELEEKKIELEEMNAKLEDQKSLKESNVDTVNSIADGLTGDAAISDKTSYGSLGYYSEVEDRLSYLSGSYSTDDDDDKEDSNKVSVTEIDIDVIKNNLSSCLSYADKAISELENANVNTTDARDIYNKISALSKDELYTELSEMNRCLNDLSSGKSVSYDRFEIIADMYEGLNKIYTFMVNNKSNTVFRSSYNNFKNSYEIMEDELKKAYDGINTIDLLCKENSEGNTILNCVLEMQDITSVINTYENDISDLEAEIAALEKKLQEFIDEFNNTVFSLDFYWDSEEITGEFLNENYLKYDEIIANLDEYLSAYESLYNVADYRGSADKAVSNIETLNTDYDINRIIDSMYAAVNMGTGNETYSVYADYVKYLYSNKNQFYRNISAALNSAASIYSAETEDTSDYSEEDSNTNIKLIKEGIEAYYSSFGENAMNVRTYNQILADCETIYNNLYKSFTKISTITSDGETEICDVTVDTVLEYVCQFLIDEYNITVLSYTDETGAEVTTTIAKSADTGGNISVENTTETTTSEGYIQNLYAVYGSYSSVLSYANNMYEIYKNIGDLAFTLFYGTGSLTDEQIETIDNSSSNYSSYDLGSMDDAQEDDPIFSIDYDPTSDYNLGYVPAYKICKEMSTLIEQAKTYYETREAAAALINSASSKHMTLALRDDKYYVWLYKEKCTQADYLQKLLYNAAQTVEDSKERQALIDEFNAKDDWLILDDITVNDDLSSIMTIQTDNLKVTYKKVVWNTALIDTEVDVGSEIESIVTDEPYEMYPMKSNFAVVVNADRGYVVPMGVQADAYVTALNEKIKEEINKNSMSGNVDNVAYGYDDKSGYDILLFSNSGTGKWFMITFKQSTRTDSSGNKIVSIDKNNVLGYRGKFDTENMGSDMEDTHFLEYEHTLITGLNQFYSATIENGFIPYDVKLVSGGLGSITPAVEFVETEPEDPVTGIADGSVGVEGAFFNAWNFIAGSKGYVALLGYKKEDMAIADDDETETTTEASEYYNSDTAADEETEETTEEIQYREIADSDIYDAHIYIYAFDTKAATASGADESSEEDYYNLEYAMLSDLVAELTGPYGDLVKTPIIYLEYVRVPLLVLAYAILTLYCIRLGVKYASADDEEKRIKAKQHLKWFIIGVLCIHIVMCFLYCSYRQLKSWEESFTVETQTDEGIVEEIQTGEDN